MTEHRHWGSVFVSTDAMLHLPEFVRGVMLPFKIENIFYNGEKDLFELIIDGHPDLLPVPDGELPPVYEFDFYQFGELQVIKMNMRTDT